MPWWSNIDACISGVSGGWVFGGHVFFFGGGIEIPRKIRAGTPKNGGLEDDFPLSIGDFSYIPLSISGKP